jgi:hypothetical protein
MLIINETKSKYFDGTFVIGDVLPRQQKAAPHAMSFKTQLLHSTCMM